jgi:hypothetical protein
MPDFLGMRTAAPDHNLAGALHFALAVPFHPVPRQLRLTFRLSSKLKEPHRMRLRSRVASVSDERTCGAGRRLLRSSSGSQSSHIIEAARDEQGVLLALALKQRVSHGRHRQPDVIDLWCAGVKVSCSCEREELRAHRSCLSAGRRRARSARS